MKFFKTLAKSVYGPDFYQNIKERTFGQALGYSIGIFFLTFLLGTSFLATRFLIQGEFTPANIADTAATVFPDELEFTIENGSLTSNVDEPYFVKAGEHFESLSVDPEFNIFVIDTVTPFSSEQFYAYETLAWFAEDSLHMMDDNGLRTIPYELEEPITINEEAVVDFANKASTLIVPIALGLLGFGAIFGVLFLTAGRLVVNLFFALVTLIAAKIKNLDWEFGECYIASLHLLTLPTLLGPVLLLLNLEIPFFRLLVFLVVIGVNLAKMPASKKTKS